MHGLKAKPHFFLRKESWNQSDELLLYVLINYFLVLSIWH